MITTSVTQVKSTPQLPMWSHHLSYPGKSPFQLSRYSQHLSYPGKSPFQLSRYSQHLSYPGIVVAISAIQVKIIHNLYYTVTVVLIHTGSLVLIYPGMVLTSLGIMVLMQLLSSHVQYIGPQPHCIMVTTSAFQVWRSTATQYPGEMVLSFTGSVALRLSSR